MTTIGPTSSNKRDWLLAGAIAALALTVRLVFLFGANDRAWPHSIYYEGDAPLWAEWAATLDRGEAFQHDLPIWPPGVAYLMHWIVPSRLPLDTPLPPPGSACGRDFTQLKILWCGLSALTWAIAYLAIAVEFGRRVGLVAALLGAFSFGSYVLATSLNNETPYLLVLMMIVSLTQPLLQRPRWWLGMIWGALNAIACYFRPEHPLCFLLLLGWVSSRALRRSSKPNADGVMENTSAVDIVRTGRGLRNSHGWTASFALVAFFATLSPWIWHSHRAAVRHNTIAERPVDYEHAKIPWQPDARQFLDAMPAFARADNFEFITDMLAQAGRQAVTAVDARGLLVERFGALPEPIATWKLVSSQGPLSFALANYPRGNGGFSKAALGDDFGSDPQLHLAHPRHLNLVNHGYRIGWEWIRNAPNQWILLAGRKLGIFWCGVTQGFGAADLPLGRAGVRRAVDLITPAAPLWSIAYAVLLLVGLGVAAKRRAGGVWLLIIAYKLIVTILFYGYARQAASIQPAFLVFVALTLVEFAELIMRGRVLPRTPLRIFVALILAGFLAFDTFTARQTAVLVVRGDARLAPEWAPNAIHAPATIELRWSGNSAPGVGR